MHAFVARLPQTSQSCSAAAEGGGGSADAADEKAGADAEADPDDAAREGVVGEGGDTAQGVAEFDGTVTAPDGADADADSPREGGVGEEGTGDDVDGPVAALGGFPPFCFIIGWMLGGTESADEQQRGLVHNHCTVLSEFAAAAARGSRDAGR